MWATWLNLDSSSKCQLKTQLNDQFTDQSKLRDAVLTNIKENDLLIQNCFLCHKSDHTSKECLNRSFRINALDDEFNHSLNFDSESDLKN